MVRELDHLIMLGVTTSNTLTGVQTPTELSRILLHLTTG